MIKEQSNPFVTRKVNMDLFTENNLYGIRMELGMLIKRRVHLIKVGGD